MLHIDLQDPLFNSFGVRVDGSCDNSLIFLRNYQTFPVFYIPTNRAQGYISFCASSLTLVICLCSVLIMAILMGVRVVSHCGLVCISLMIGDVEHLFTCYWPFVFFGELSVQVLCPFLVVFLLLLLTYSGY